MSMKLNNTALSFNRTKLDVVSVCPKENSEFYIIQQEYKNKAEKKGPTNITTISYQYYLLAKRQITLIYYNLLDCKQVKLTQTLMQCHPVQT